MRRQATVLLTVVVLVATLGAAPAPALAQSDDATDTVTATPTPEPDASTDADADANPSSNASVQSGALLSGVVAVQEAEIEGEIRTRTFGIRVAEAATDEAKADVVADQLTENGARLDELESRKERLDRALENGSMSRAEYEARVAGLAAETTTVAELTNRSVDASRGLPNELLESNGVDASSIRTLSTRAENLSGPEVAAIARRIAGPASNNERRGPPGDVPGHETDAANASSPGGNETAPEKAGKRGTASENAADGEATGAGSGTETPATDSGDSESDGTGPGDTRSGNGTSARGGGSGGSPARSLAGS